MKEEEIEQFCVYLRLKELMEKNPEAIAANRAFKKKSEEFLAVMKNAWDSLKEEQQQLVLEALKRPDQANGKPSAAKKKGKK